MGSSQSTAAEANAALVSTEDRSPDTSTTVQVESSNDNETTPTITLTQQHEPYMPPTSPIHPITHYIFLVHGWLGNDLEMSYLSESLTKCITRETTNEESFTEGTAAHDAKRVKRSPSQIDAMKEESEEIKGNHPPVIVHSVKCNVGKTHDGIKNGGTRLAHEIVDFIQSDLQTKLPLDIDSKEATDGTTSLESQDESSMEVHVTYSIVGNSLGGLYARYAISLVPRQLSIPRPNQTSSSSHQQRIHLHPNTFCTTATPHLGVSQHTYLPIPRVAETIIGSGMGKTGTDLFRLNSDKTGRENMIGAGVRKLSGAEGVLSGAAWKRGSNSDNGTNSHSGDDSDPKAEEEMECIIRNMCLQEKYLSPLRNFRKRIAYANAYRTDFQVPTETAAFLNAKSQVEHTVIACRDVREHEDVHVEDGKRERDGNSNVNTPQFVVAVVRTEQQPMQSEEQLPSLESPTPKDELLQMSQSLDALGWTKVFIDVRNRIPLPGIPKPSWRLLPFPSALSTMFPEPDTSLDDLIHSRGCGQEKDSSSQKEAITNTEHLTTVTSSELVQSTNAGQTVHFPMGHTVMVANSKSDTYTKLNYQGRPVMDKLAVDMLSDVLEFC